MKIVKSLIGISALVISAATMADEFIVQQQRVNVNQRVIVDAIDERIGDIAIMKFAREERKRINAEKAAAWAAYVDAYGILKAGNPYFPYVHAEFADEILSLAKEAEETPALSVAKTLKNWDNYSF